MATLTNSTYYCSVGDVEDVLTEFDRSIGNNPDTQNLDRNKLRRFIGLTHGRINAALARGSYQIPASSSVSALTSGGGLTDSENTVNVTIDTTKFTTADFPVGSTVRFIGFSANPTQYEDEFAVVVTITSASIFVVEWLKNSYVTTSTIELVTNGLETLRHINSQGAALLSVGALTLGFATSSNDKEDNLSSAFTQGLKDIQEGNARLDGVPRNTVTSFIVKEGSDGFNQGEPVYTDGMLF